MHTACREKERASVWAGLKLQALLVAHPPFEFVSVWACKAARHFTCSLTLSHPCWCSNMEGCGISGQLPEAWSDGFPKLR